MKKHIFIGLLLLSGVVAGCQPKTPAEKVEDKVDDTAHETGQALERAGDKAKDATN